jgi:aspartyl-tRNA(Asn)/glutamyl-tRNA(Gln) amidotransferase subunit A
MGWLYRDLQDGPLLAPIFAPAQVAEIRTLTRFAVVNKDFLDDCEPEIVANLRIVGRELEALGLEATEIDVAWWAESFKIFAPIQAWEAARIHAGYFDKFEPAIRERFEWGARITGEEIASLRQRHAEFRDRIDELVAKHQLLLMPAAPVTRLSTGVDHSQTRNRLLRYTTPFSLAGFPVVTIPCAAGGMQLAGPREWDESLLALTAVLGAARKATDSLHRR